MARIKLAYIGGGSTRAAGTMASFIAQGENFSGSEVVLIDLDEERLQIVESLARKMTDAAGLDLTITATTDRRAGLTNSDAVLTSFRPGGFEARYLDESIPLKYGVIGQETQGPGGMFMAMRSIVVMKDILADIEAAAPRARIFNYTNPVNIVSEAITHHSDIPIVSLCEGPVIFQREVAEAVGLDPEKLDATLIGINHACWSVSHRYDGQELMPVLREAYESAVAELGPDSPRLRMVRLALAVGSIPASYMQYYYFRDEVLAELQAKKTTRAEDILASVPDYWTHYREQLGSDFPSLDPSRSRGGIHELELAIDVMDAMFNDKGEVLPVNVPNQGAIPGFADDRVVEVPGRVTRQGIEPISQPALPLQVRGLVYQLAEYQAQAAEAGWSGTRIDGIRALAAHPLVMSLDVAERMYDELAHAHRDYLPDRLVTGAR